MGLLDEPIDILYCDSGSGLFVAEIVPQPRFRKRGVQASGAAPRSRRGYGALRALRRASAAKRKHHGRREILLLRGAPQGAPATGGQ